MRVIQFINKGELTAGKIVDQDTVQPIKSTEGLYGVVMDAISSNSSLTDYIESNLMPITFSYQEIIDEGRLQLPLTHPTPEKCLVSGTGLTHLGSADTRANMHAEMSEAAEAEMTDTMKIFKLGVDGGKPDDGQIGSLPEWFYKGDGHSLVAPGSDLPSHGFSLDGGEEPELVGIYIVGEDGQPYRVGFAIGNEFSDHVTERGNYLWLAHSKLQYSSFGPELFIGELPKNLVGKSSIKRAGQEVWSKEFLTGEDNMSHSIANLEHHHFKYPQFLQSGNMHVHYFGTSTLSFGDGFQTQDGDVFEISIPEFGRSLVNSIVKDENSGLVQVNVL